MISSMDERDRASNNNSRLCDYCDSSVALLYCKADSAKLCLACDKDVHVTNQLFSKHFRSLLCDSCHDSPSSVFCETERSALCQNCDWETHTNAGGSSSSVHSRRPVEGFSGCPSVTEFLAILGLDDLSDKAPSESEMLLWDTPEIVSLNDLMASAGSSGHNFRAMDVPPLPKNRHATCGKYKQEMITQLRQLSRSDPNSLKYETFDAAFHFLASDSNDDLFPTCQVSGLKWFEGSADDDFHYFPSQHTNLSESEEIPDHGNWRSTTRACSQDSSVMVPVSGILTRSQEETLMPPVCTSTTRSILPTHEINSVERNSALSRYKEKKKSRRYEKHIRYVSRQVRAESRTRVRGRFAKADP